MSLKIKTPLVAVLVVNPDRRLRLEKSAES